MAAATGNDIVAAPGAGGRGKSRRGGSNRRRRGRGGGSPLQNQAPPPFQPGPPKPQHLTTSATAPFRNDPLWLSNVFPRVELIPIPRVHHIHSTCEALMTVIAVAYHSIVAASKTFSRNVPQSAFAYYCAVCCWARLLKLHIHNGYGRSVAEERFVDQVTSMNLRIPRLLAHYLGGFGNTSAPEGGDIRFRLLDRTYATVEGISGWFGQVSAATQPLYQSYPCLAVYVARLFADVSNSQFDAVWQLPVNIRPAVQGAVAPTEALLGYAPRARINDQQRYMLEANGVVQGMNPRLENNSLPLLLYIMMVVQSELDTVDSIKKDPIPTQLVGSVGQLGVVHIEDEIVNDTPSKVVYCSEFWLPGEISFSAAAFLYRPEHKVTELLGQTSYNADDYDTQYEHAPWGIYRFTRGIPLALAGAGNTARDAEPFHYGARFLFRTPSYLVRCRIEELEKALNSAGM